MSCPGRDGLSVTVWAWCGCVCLNECKSEKRKKKWKLCLSWKNRECEWKTSQEIEWDGVQVSLRLASVWVNHSDVVQQLVLTLSLSVWRVVDKRWNHVLTDSHQLQTLTLAFCDWLEGWDSLQNFREDYLCTADRLSHEPPDKILWQHLSHLWNGNGNGQVILHIAFFSLLNLH